MFLVRDIMYCKPGKARAMVDKFVALSAISQKIGMGAMRVMTDVSAERYWTVVSEMEVPSLDALSDRATKASKFPDDAEVPAFARKVVCAKCGARGRRIDVRPNWKEQPTQPSLSGKQWR